MPGTRSDQSVDPRLAMLPELECAADVPYEPVEAIAACTDRLLAQHVEYCYERSGFYRARFDRAGVKPQDIRCVADLRRLPFTTKADLAGHMSELLCVPARQACPLLCCRRSAIYSASLTTSNRAFRPLA